MCRLRIASWAIVLWTISSTSFSLSAEIYRWTDEKGSVHFTDDLSNIPPSYRNQVEKKEFNGDLSGQNEDQIDSGRKSDAVDNAKSPGKQGEKRDRVSEYLKGMEEKLTEKKSIEKNTSKLEEEREAAVQRIKELEKDEEENYPAMQPFQSHSGKFGFVSVETPHHREKVKLVNRIRAIRDEIETLEKRLAEIRRTL